MLDIHCHLMPAIDDGAKDEEDALNLVQCAVDDGIKRIVITPHLHLGRYENYLSKLQKEFTKFNKKVMSKDIDVELAFAAEIRFDSGILKLLSHGDLPCYGTYNGSKYLLLEMPHNHIPEGMLPLIKYLESKKIIPVIAHPERNREIMKAPEKINNLIRAGCWFQVTGGSILGDFGSQCQDVASYFLDLGIVNIVASDGHNLKHRPPVLSKARAVVAKEYGESVAQELFWDNPYKITESLFNS